MVASTSAFLVVDEMGNCTPLANSGMVAAKIAFLYGPDTKPGSGALKMRTDSAGTREWNNHKVSMDMLRGSIKESLKWMELQGSLIRNDDFMASLGAAGQRDLVFKFEKALEEKLPELASTRVFHQNTQVAPGAQQYEQKRIYGSGEAIVYGSSGSAVDIPLVGFGQTSFLAPVKYLISAAEVNWLENLSTNFAGLDQTALKTRRMRRVIAELIDQWAWLGSDDHGIRGLFNHPYIDSALSMVPYTNDSSTDDITADFGYWARWAQNSSLGTFRADTLLISEKLEGELSNRPMGDNADKNVLDWMLSANKHLVGFESLARLNDIGGPGIHGMAFVKAQGGPAEVSVEIMNVMPETMLPPDVQALQTKFYTVAATGGLNMTSAGDNLVVYVQGVE